MRGVWSATATGSGFFLGTYGSSGSNSSCTCGAGGRYATALNLQLGLYMVCLGAGARALVYMIGHKLVGSARRELARSAESRRSTAGRSAARARRNARRRRAAAAARRVWKRMVMACEVASATC